MEQKSTQMAHKVILNQRNHLTVTGVTEVVSFDDGAVVLKTDLGTLVIQGRQLQLKTLATEGGQVTVEGSVVALTYEEPKEKGGWLHRLLG
jgi:sporulation protein YabP